MPALALHGSRRRVGEGPAEETLAALYAGFGLRAALTSSRGVPVWRCRAPRDTAPEDLVRFGELGLGDVWDLRTGDERASVPGLLMPGLRVHTVPGRLYPPNHDRLRREIRGEGGPADGGAPACGGSRPACAADADGGPAGCDVPGTPGRAGDALARQLEHGRTGRRAPGERMLTIYRSMAENADALAPVVRALALADRPVLVCCTSGKDRTGVACYCAQRALGVSHEKARASYLATNAANARVNADDLAALAARGVPPWRLEVALSLFIAKEEYLDAFLEGIDARYGSLDAYLDRCLTA